MSYDATAEILDLYNDSWRIVYGIHYSAADRYRGAEVMFFSPLLRAPRVKDGCGWAKNVDQLPCEIGPGDSYQAPVWRHYG